MRKVCLVYIAHGFIRCPPFFSSWAQGQHRILRCYVLLIFHLTVVLLRFVLFRIVSYLFLCF